MSDIQDLTHWVLHIYTVVGVVVYCAKFTEEFSTSLL
jgi:hypothetical protein